MNCPNCSHELKTTTTLPDGSVVVRKRSCPRCLARYMTKEEIIACASPGMPPRDCLPTSAGTYPQVPATPPSDLRSGSDLSPDLRISRSLFPEDRGRDERTGPARGRQVQAEFRQLVSDAMGWFRNAWQGKYRETWKPEAGVRKQLEVLVRELGAETPTLEGAFRDYVQLTDQYLERERHPLRLYLQNPNRRAAPPTRTYGRASLENMNYGPPGERKL